LNRQLRTLSNYTSPLPNARIESALRGARYDAYIRWILAEGMAQVGAKAPWWSDVNVWPSCPDVKAKKPLHSAAATFLRSAMPHSSTAVRKLSSLLGGGSSTASSASSSEWDPADVDRTDEPLCPYAWSEKMHPLVCQYAFATPVPEKGGMERPELDGEYAARIDE